MADKLKAEARTSFGKGAARKIRAAHKIPAVIYGHGTDPQHVTLPGHEVALIVRRANAVIDLDIDGSSQLVLVKDVQRDPVRQIIEHLDLVVIRRGEKVEVEVPVHVEGESAAGTLANLDATTLTLQVEATNIPQNVVVDVEGLEDGAQITAGQVTLPEGAALAIDPETLVVGVTLTPAEESEEGEESEAAAEGDEAAETETTEESAE